MQKFWNKVDVRESKRACWEWQGGFKNEYGGFYHKGEQHYAHVFSFKITHGLLLPGMKVLHKCDNPKCINPYHLKSGSQSDNMVDAFQKGRLFINTVSKLTTGKVDQIRALEGKHTHQVIADMFGVNRRTIGRIYTGEYWAHHKTS